MKKRIFTLTKLFATATALVLALSPTIFGRELHPYLQHSKWGFIDDTGKVIVPAQYKNYGELSEGLIAVHNGEKWGFIDTTGKVVIDFQFDDPLSITQNNPKFSEGLACVQIAAKHKAKDTWNRYGYIDKSGKFVIPPVYKHAYDFSDGLAVVLIGGRHGYINKAGSVVIKPQLYVGHNFSDGLSAMAVPGRNDTYKWGYIDKAGKVVIRPQFEWATDFHEGHAAVRIKGKWGFIDKNGKIVVQPVYDKVGNFNDGLAAVAISDTPLNPGETFHKGRWGYVDKSGSLVIPLRFVEAKQFSEGLACVKFEDPASPLSSIGGYIDRTGKTIIAPQFRYCTEFERGIAWVGFAGESGLESGLMNKAGKIIWRSTNQEMHNPKKNE